MPDRMIPAKELAVGRVTGLALNGAPQELIVMNLNGPEGDSHASSIYDAETPGYQGDGVSLGRHGEDQDARWAGMTTTVTGHHRKWTALSTDENESLARALQIKKVPVGGLLETLQISNIASFSAIPPGFELAFFRGDVQHCRLLVREPNTPCSTAARALYRKVYGDEKKASADFITTFKAEAALARGLMGDVILTGEIRIGDEVRVFSSKRHPAADIWWTKARAA